MEATKLGEGLQAPPCWEPWDGLRHLPCSSPSKAPVLSLSSPAPSPTAALRSRAIDSQLCPSKLSWLSAQFVSSSHSGAKYLYYYCNYFPISTAQGCGGQRGGPDKRIDGQPLPWGLLGTGREALAAAKHREEQAEDGGTQGPLCVMLWPGRVAVLGLCHPSAKQRRCKITCARSVHAGTEPVHSGCNARALPPRCFTAKPTGAPGHPRGHHSSCWGIDSPGRER